MNQRLWASKACIIPLRCSPQPLSLDLKEILMGGFIYLHIYIYIQLYKIIQGLWGTDVFYEARECCPSHSVIPRKILIIKVAHGVWNIWIPYNWMSTSLQTLAHLIASLSLLFLYLRLALPCSPTSCQPDLPFP